jgi:hypothetical protein
MLTSISPLGEGARQARWWRTTTSYVGGSVVAGAGFGAALGALGALASPGRAAVAVVAGLAVVAAVLDAIGRVPAYHRQVDENWLHRYRDWVYGGGYGLQLGLGAVTIVTSAATYLTWLLELASGHWWTGLAVGATFGLARALPLLTMVDVHDAPTLRDRHARLVAALPTARVVTVAGQAAAAGVLAAAAARAVG